MPRDDFETEEDRRNEREIVEQLLQVYWQCDGWLKLSKAYAVDAVLKRGERPIMLFEIKNRPTLGFGYRDGYYLSSLKVLRAQQYAAFCQLPLRLAVRFSDRAIFTSNLDQHFQLICFGRNNPRDEYDREPCAVIPWTCFRPLHDHQSTSKTQNASRETDARG